MPTCRYLLKYACYSLTLFPNVIYSRILLLYNGVLFTLQRKLVFPLSFQLWHGYEFHGYCKEQEKAPSSCTRVLPWSNGLSTVPELEASCEFWKCRTAGPYFTEPESSSRWGLDYGQLLANQISVMRGKWIQGMKKSVKAAKSDPSRDYPLIYEHATPRNIPFHLSYS